MIFAPGNSACIYAKCEGILGCQCLELNNDSRRCLCKDIKLVHIPQGEHVMIIKRLGEKIFVISPNFGRFWVYSDEIDEISEDVL